ncbi:cytochrome c peroxidase [Haloferula sp. BvORR071]|uniref:cytochrome-c peroxidase n=1 Tax=Haloferula sp. BvORR071 TaxID=1396141 RepID=UPI002240EB93|nr:cytochrome c peroxidase [Haloferula sp. BvORR071]
MKTILLLPVLTLPALAQVAVQVPVTNSSVQFSRAESGFVLDVSDPGNHAWMLQTSSDLGTWTNVKTHRVFNGSLQILLIQEGPQRFYRLNPDLAESVSSAAADALILPPTAFNYANPTLPAHLLTPQIRGQDNTPLSNPTTNAGAALGRVLFYDKRLSANQTISCSSCHQAEHGFSDSRRFSVGFNGGLTGRNSMGLTNNRYYLRQNYFWDERAATLEAQVLQPIQNAVEMGMTLDDVVTRVSVEPYYAELFTTAFGTPEVNSTRIARALAQFVRSIVSGNSKYDQGVAQNFTNFTAQENQGRAIFQGPVGGCAACHGSDNFVPGNAIFNNGIENPSVDLGLGGISGSTADNGFFKVPSLRNIELTAPYMHDGRFATLEQVVEFYNSGVTNHPNLSPQLRLPPGPPGSPPPGPRRLNLTQNQKDALVAFLKTLTDTTLTKDPKYSDPFRYEAK